VKTFIKGQKAKLSDLGVDRQLSLRLDARLSDGSALEFCCIGLDAGGKFLPGYALYQSERQSACQAITYTPETHDFSINLNRLAPGVQRLVFTLAGSSALKQLQNSRLTLQTQGREVGSFSFSGADFTHETAIVLVELYVKDVWRFGTVAAGFQDGMDALAQSYGCPAGQFIPVKEVGKTVPATSERVSLSKITLEKKGEKQAVDLRKDGGAQPIHFNLNWDHGNPKARTWFARTQQADLDLGCMYVLQDGSMGVIQPLGGNFGSAKGHPYIYLDKDDRSGAAADGENLYLFKPETIRFVMVFALIYEGAQDFSQVGGRMTIRDHVGNEIFIRLNAPDPGLGFCSICTIENVGNQIEIVKEERYFLDHQDADKYYGFGFHWTAGSK
jgi:tellurite resistance protein TerA